MFEHFLYMFESRLKYGLEFYGVTSNFVMTPSTEKVFVSMSIAMCEMKVSFRVRPRFKFHCCLVTKMKLFLRAIRCCIFL